MKYLAFASIAAVAFCVPTQAQEVPALFKGVLKPNEPVKAELVVVVPPAEIEKYIGKVEESAAKDPEWFTEYSKTAKPGIPLPYSEKLGLTKEEYETYISLWNKREFKVAQEVALLLRLGSQGRWNIVASGNAAPISSMRYSVKDDDWKSANGVMKRLEDIDADPQSILGGWKGKEWKFEEETTLSKLKENFAIGTTNDGKYHLMVYRAQEITATGTRLLDKSIVLRFPKAPAAAVVKPKKK